jgi:hypothetical protein
LPPLERIAGETAIYESEEKFRLPIISQALFIFRTMMKNFTKYISMMKLKLTGYDKINSWKKFFLST